MKAPASIKTPADYIASLPTDRKVAVQTLHKAIIKAAPSLKPCVVHGMLGYGPFHYKYKSGHEGDTAVVALASQKNYLSLYIMAAEGDSYVAEKNMDRLGKVSVGKSCIRFKKLEDLNLPVAMEVVKTAARLQKDVVKAGP